MRVVNEPAYVLESRPYRETSLLLDVLTRDYGRLAMVAKGVRGASRHQRHQRALLEPFRSVRMAFSGRGEVLTLGAIEPEGVPLHPVGNALFAALYVNELVQKTTGRGDPSPALFERYGRWLQEFMVSRTSDASASVSERTAMLEWSLRRFERDLLEILGYALELKHDSDSGEIIDSHTDYAFDPVNGARLWQPGDSWMRINGMALLAWSQEALPDADTLASLKQLARQIIRHHLGDAELKSMKLAVDWRGGEVPN